MIEKEVTSCNVDIFIGGSYEDAVRACREYTITTGLCVTVTPTTFVYTGGAEDGVRVGLINYPRFPKPCQEICDTAEDLAIWLMAHLHQQSVSIVGSNRTKWLSRRPEDQLSQK